MRRELLLLLLLLQQQLLREHSEVVREDMNECHWYLQHHRQLKHKHCNNIGCITGWLIASGETT